MKILSLHIDAFGKLRDFELDFESGITEILAENGFGKTTLAAFIKSMFYGLPDNRAKDKARKLYAPWSGGDFGGSMDIETEKGRYRISRRFSATGADRFELLSLETLLPSDDYSEKIGLEIFCVDAESYEKSSYLPQHKVDIKMTDKISARFNELLEGSSGGVDFSKAIETIKDRRRELALYKGEGGLIFDTKNEISSTESRIAASEELIRNAEALRVEADGITADAEKTQSDIDMLSATLAEENEKKLIRKDREIYAELCREAKAAETKAGNIRKCFALGIPEDNEIDAAENADREIIFNRRKRAELCQSGVGEADGRLEKMFKSGAPSNYELAQKGMDARIIEEHRKELEKAKEELPNIPQNSTEAQNVSYKGILFGGIVLAAIGAILIIVGAIVLPLLIAVGAVLSAMGAAFAFVSFDKKKKEAAATEQAERLRAEAEEKRAKFDEKQKNLLLLEREFFEFLSQYGANTDGEPQNLIHRLADDVEQYEKAAKKAEEQRDFVRALDAQIDKKEAELEIFFRKYGFTGENEKTPAEIRKLVEELSRLTAEGEQKQKRAEEFKREKDLSDDIDEEALDIEALEAAIKNAQRKHSELIAKRSKLIERAEQFEGNADELPSLKDRLCELNEQVREYTGKCEIYDKTEKFLTQAKENLSSRYAVNMKNSFVDRLHFLTDNEKEVQIDAKLEVKLRDEGGAKKSELYSTGWQEIMAICLRLSLVDALYEQNRPCLILDDPFVNLDGEKLTRALSMLKKIAEDTQIIYLTCHESRSVK